MRIVAQRESGEYLLIETSDSIGRVWHRAANELFPAQSVAATAKFGYWERYDGSESAERIVRSARRFMERART